MPINGLNELALTKMDVMDGFDTIKVCTSYRIGDTETKVFPLSLKKLEKVKPIYTELRGWDQDISGITNWDELPDTAQDYIRFLEKYLGISFKIISTDLNEMKQLFAKIY